MPDDSAKWRATVDRLHFLSTLGPGWYGGSQSPPSAPVLRQVSDYLLVLRNHGCPPPRLYPTLEAGIQAEWTIGGCAVEVEFMDDGALPVASATHPNGMDVTWDCPGAGCLVGWLREFGEYQA